MSTQFNKKRLPANPKTLRSIGRKIAPILAPAVTRQPWLNYIRWFETYLALLQGKGAGDGWELKAEVHVAAKLVERRNPVIFDVGANVGKWSKIFLNKRPDAQMFLFEPAPACHAAIEDLHLSKAKIIRSAVGRRKETALLHTCNPTAEIASLYARRVSAEVKFSSFEVPVVRLDDIIEEFQIEIVDFIKLDIEGAELDALLGAAAALRSGTIRALSFEFGMNNIDSRTFFRDFWDLLVPLGFSVFRIAPGGTLMRIREYREELEYFKIVSNYVAVRSNDPMVPRQKRESFAAD
jgi:FkbM family methyltransferase